MMVEMDRHGRNVHGSCVVLHFSQLLRQIWDEMVLDDDQGAGDRPVRSDDIRQKHFSSQIEEGLRSLRTGPIAPLGNQPIELGSQILFQRKADPA
jgi:hypothetical protein